MLPIRHVWIEPVLAAWIRGRLPLYETPLLVTRVSNHEMGPIRPGQLQIIVRDDGGSRRDLVLKDQQIGVSFLAGSPGDLPDAREVADRLIAEMEALLPLDSTVPVADVTGVNGPYTVPTPDGSTRLYASMTLTLTGVEIAP